MKPLLVLSLLALVVPLAPAKDHTPPAAVIDGAKMFGSRAIQRVQYIADEIRETYGIDLCIETLAEAPPDVQKARTARDVDRALRPFAQNRADDRHVEGLYVLIVQKPPHVLVVGWPSDRERERILSDHKRKMLHKRLMANLAASPDDTLVRAVEHYRASLESLHAPSPLSTLPALIMAAALVGFWIFLLLVRSRLSGPDGPLPLYQPAMQGSLFGVPAGFWVHDRLFQAERPVLAPLAAPLPDLPAPPTPLPAEEGITDMAGEPVPESIVSGSSGEPS